MAPKRAAKKAVPPPPPAESSDDETRSRSDESDDEDAIADSPVPASTPALKKTPAPPSHKGGESESESDSSEEEEEEPARAAPKNQPPPPQEKEGSDASGSDEEEEEEEEEEEPAPKNQPSPAAKKSEESDASDEEEEENEEEAPPLNPAPAPAPKKDLKPPAAAAESKKPGAFHRIWSTGDEVRILEALAAHQKEHGALMQPEALVDVLAGKLDNPSYGSKELQSKVKSLRSRYVTVSKRVELPSKEHDRRLLDLSKIIWGGGGADKTSAAANNSQERKGFEEMCELYPYLAEEVQELEAVHPGMCKREFGKMDDDKARAMDEKIKKQRVVQIKVDMRRKDLIKEVTKALMDLLDG